MSSYSKILSFSRPRTISLSLPERGVINFFFPKKKKLQKEVGEPAVRSPRRAGCRPRKFRPHLTHKPSVQMGCHRGISDAPNHRFFPTECVQQNLNFISRTAPRAPYGHRRGLRVGASVRAPLSLPLTGEGDHEVVERASLPLRVAQRREGTLKRA